MSNIKNLLYRVEGLFLFMYITYTSMRVRSRHYRLIMHAIPQSGYANREKRVYCEPAKMYTLYTKFIHYKCDNSGHIKT